jgi:hypothetical protein
MSRVVLLGPRPSPEAFRSVLDDLAPTGPVATIRAGWQEWEADPSPLSQALGDRAVPLDLHSRAERAWRTDPELMEAHRAMQQGVRLLRRAYNLGLSAAMGAWAEIGRLDDPAGVLAAERTAALEAVRVLDERQRTRIAEIRNEFEARTVPAERPALARERNEILDLLDGAGAVVVDGGHVAVLLNRIRMFGLDGPLAGLPTVGVSGGAMVLTDRVVLFHDCPPWGPGHAEVAEAGLGIAPGIVVFPDGEDRLVLDEPDRVGRLARRLAPAECVVLDGGARVDWDGDRWTVELARRLGVDGDVSQAGAAA